MHADDIRLLYGYHFRANRKLWDTCIISLSDEQFLQSLDYSVGSIRNQMVHMMDIEEGWFEGLITGREGRDPFKQPEGWTTREQIRADWDVVEDKIKAYIAGLTDDKCNQPMDASENALRKWQVMLHVLNHATDHRAQTLAMLYRLGAPTFAQDMVYHFWNVL
jgi:uncharacterized damage-inducible protein DinB